MSDMSSPPVGSTPPKDFIRVLGLRDLKPGEENPALKPDPSEDCFGKKDDTGGSNEEIPPMPWHKGPKYLKQYKG